MNRGIDETILASGISSCHLNYQPLLFTVEATMIVYYVLFRNKIASTRPMHWETMQEQQPRRGKMLFTAVGFFLREAHSCHILKIPQQLRSQEMLSNGRPTSCQF